MKNTLAKSFQGETTYFINDSEPESAINKYFFLSSFVLHHKIIIIYVVTETENENTYFAFFSIFYQQI